MTDSDANLPARAPVERVVVNSPGEAAVTQAATAGQSLMGVLRIGAGTLTRTVTRMVLLGIVLAIAAGRIAGATSGTAGFLAVMLTLGITLVLALILAWQRAGLLALAEAIENTGIASRMFKAVFNKIIGGTDGDDEMGRISRTVGRTPASQAEVRLDEALQTTQPEFQTSGLLAGVFRRVRNILVATIRRVTVAEFRKDDTGAGVDLTAVRDRLADRVGGIAAAKIRQRVRWITIGLVLLTIVSTMAAAWGLRQLFA